MSYIEKGTKPTDLTFSTSKYDKVLEKIDTRNPEIFKELNYWNYEDRDKIGEILFNPFLRTIFNKDLLPWYLVLKKYDDGDVLELIYEHNNFYLAFYDDWEQEYTVYERHSLDIELIIDKLEKNDEFKEYIDLNKSNQSLNYEIEKLAYNIVIEKKSKMSKYSNMTGFIYNTTHLEILFYEKIFGNYDEYPELAFVGTYYFLTGIDKLFDYINKVIENIALSQGFIVYENREYEYNRKINETTKDKINNILNNKDISINNIKTKVLDTLKSDIVDSSISSIYFANKPIFTDKEIQDRYSHKYLPKFNVFNFVNRNIDCKYRNLEKHCLKLDEQEINLSGQNLMNFSLDIIPKCYAPVKSYIVQISYYFKQEGRVNFIKDFPNEKVSMQEIMNWNIDIDYIKIYDMEEYQEDTL